MNNKEKTYSDFLLSRDFKLNRCTTDTSLNLKNSFQLTLMRYLVISLPAISNRLVRWGREKPS